VHIFRTALLLVEEGIMSINLPVSHSLFFSLAETLQGEDRKQITSRPNDREGTLHQEKIHLLENGLKALKTAFECSKSSQAV
jgi:hypothetical protein